MTRLATVLGLGIVVAVSSFASGFSENFESYNVGQAITGTNDWQSSGLGGNFQANATVSGDPSVLGQRYADLSRNDNSPAEQDGWLWQTFDGVSAGTLTLEFDSRFQAAGALYSCTIFLCSSDRVPSLSSVGQTVGISVDVNGLRIHDGGWRVVTNFNLLNDTWYHTQITVDFDAKTWQMAMGAYVGDTVGAMTTVSYSGDDSFTFIAPAVNDIGMIEFSTTPDIMNDPDARGFHVDNINVPEPATLSVLAIAGVLAMRRRNA